MWPIATDVAPSVVCLSVCLWWARWAVLKQMNQLRCNLGADSCVSKEQCSRWGPDSPTGMGTFIRIRSMSHLQFHRAILSSKFIAWQSCSLQLCMSHIATLSHKQELTNQLNYGIFFSGVKWTNILRCCNLPVNICVCFQCSTTSSACQLSKKTTKA